MERAGEEIFWIIVRQKKSLHFSGKGCCEKCTEKSKTRKERQKGLIAKIDANNLCQRKLL